MKKPAKWNPNKADDIRHLKRAIESDQKALKQFCDLRNEALKKYAGPQYSDGASRLKRPVNFMALGATIMVRQLIARRPRALVTSFSSKYRASAVNLGLAIDEVLKKIQLDKTLKSVVLDAIFSMGIVKTGVFDGDDGMPGDYRFGAGYPYACRVDLDDWVHDTQARCIEEASYLSNTYRQEFDFVMESEIYDFDRDKLRPDERRPGTDDTSADISGVKGANEDSFKKYVTLRDVWFPAERMFVTLVDNDCDIEKAVMIREVGDSAPPCGPYHILGFGEMPNNTLPLPPRALWEDLDALGNLLFRKLANQAANEKHLVGVKGKADADGNRILKASDGDMIKVEDPKAIQDIQTGGISQQNLAFFLQTKELWNYFAGNPESFGGLGAQSATLGQDELLAKAASTQIVDYQETVIDFTAKIMQDIAFYIWTDPEVNIPFKKTLRGVPGMQVESNFNEFQKQGLFSNYGFQIQPYSMQYKPPTAKLNSLTQILQTLVFPLMPQLEAAGKAIDFEALFRIVAQYADLPELEEILTSQATSPIEEAGEAEETMQAAKPPVTTRNYTRTNKSEQTGPGKAFSAMMALMGKNTGGARNAS